MKIVLSFLLLIIAFGSAYAQKSSALEAVRKADQDWLRVFAAKDLEKSVDFMTAGGAMLSPNSPIATGHEAVKKLFSNFFSLPDLKIEWHPNDVSVARSGEMAYTTGAYKMTFKDGSGKLIEDHGKYVTIWKKVQGQWKVAYDIFNSDVAVPSP